jgi:competence ComEA-like helix-hairpin-helix protein
MANADNTIDTGKQPPQRVQPESPLDAKPSRGTLSLNQASEAEIAEIDMIGKKLAHAIVTERDQRGGFNSWEELRQVPGLDAMKIAELQRATRLG